MAILAPPDWQYSPRDPAMDKGPSQSSSSSSSTPQQAPRSHQLPPAQPQHHPQPYPFQQQPQGGWTPSLAAPPFYPGAFYQNAPIPPQGAPQAYPAPAGPYFDPANAQLAAQWAYQQMMFNAQAAQQDFFAPPAMHGQFNPFPSGTPPPRQNDAPQPPYAGFHPYRRPSRQQSSHSESSNNGPQQQQDWRPQPPYSRPDASGSSSSVNSQGRTRTNSNNSQSRGSHSPSPVPSTRGSSTSGSASSAPNSSNAPPRIPHHRASSSSSTQSAHSSASSSTTTPPVSSASGSAKLARPSPLSQGAITAPAGPPRTSSTTRAERRISRDDSSLALSSLSLLATRAEAAGTSSSTTSNPPAVKGSGLKGRLRRALSFNSSVALKEEVGAGNDDDDETGEEGGNASDDSDASIKASVVNPKGPAGAGAKAKTPALIKNATRKPSVAEPFPPPSASSSASTSAPAGAEQGPQPLPPPKKKSRAASLFNSRLNASTDNISLSSTVSSASVMIRKLGSMGRLARRNSLAGITGLFKDRKKKDATGEDGEDDGEAKTDKKKDKGKKSGKSEASEASVSHATAELEAGDWSVPETGGMTGLSPAAKLARQHTLKSNAEAAAKAKEAAARAAAASSAGAGADGMVNGSGVNGSVDASGVPTWERNTATRSPGKRSGGMAVAEDGTHVFVEDSESEDEVQSPPQQQWDDEDDEEWGMLGGEEDDTIRVGVPGGDADCEDDEIEPWAVDVRRSIERARKPARGILKNADRYNQSSYLPENAYTNTTLRARSNSYNSPASGQSELGPLARMPSPDPDHIDGLHRHPSHSSAHGGADGTTSTSKRSSVPSLPPLAFELGDSVFDSPQTTPTAATFTPGIQQSGPPSGSNTLYSHPALNSSAPALVTLSAVAPSLPRASTAPVKKHIAFASNLSVYDTFSPNSYDRRSEPATWSRLTPALAQRIKEELNSYKMEEMEVHAASRIQ
ncbi:hypothetical protein GGX14DRAFT_657733 [Mycena pura]|uniref:Uncharacterized protein n=1 Tax=Mycena pura TaxID=153505 RepID=A0AAD7E112_9AGAR|nr:hypothetical protein GGX14DRAFT_657733 [Mycena pura]